MTGKVHSLVPDDVAKIMHKENFHTVIGEVRYMENGDLKEPKYEAYIHESTQTLPLEK